MLSSREVESGRSRRYHVYSGESGGGFMSLEEFEVEAMKWLAIASTHLLAFALGIRFAEWSAKEDHAHARMAGAWLRSWFVN